MSREFDAIYERGVFRPLEPVDLPELTKVHISIPETGTSPSTLDAEVAQQQAAMRDLLAWVKKQPVPPGNEVISGQDHDRILYGWKK
jgi:predicted DNA-binding antitoxin AbrB/MazE fold protein